MPWSQFDQARAEEMRATGASTAQIGSSLGYHQRTVERRLGSTTAMPTGTPPVIQPGAGTNISPAAPWYRRVPQPVLIAGGAALIVTVFILLRRYRGGSSEDAGRFEYQYAYAPGTNQLAGQASESAVVPAGDPRLESLVEAVRDLTGALGRTEPPPEPVAAGTPSSSSGYTVSPSGTTYSPADIAAMFQAAGKTITFAGSGETVEQGLARIAQQLNSGQRTLQSVQSSIAIRPY